MRVNNHLDFVCFDYESVPTNNVCLGDVIIKDVDVRTTEIGVVIQTYSDGEFRTDMFGNDCFRTGVRIATLEEVHEYRPELIKDLDICQK